MRKVQLILAVLVLTLMVSVAGVFAQEGTIVDVAAANEDFSTLVSLVQAAGLVETLAGEGPFTVFAPTNAAFAALPAPVVEYLSSNPEALTRVLTYHVVAGALMAADVATGEVATVEGSAIDLLVSDAGVRVNNANVVAADVTASNGVIHVIDAVILPEFALPEVDPLSVVDNIIIAGSSTVYPVSERMADLFETEGFGGTITVDSIGTGAGFERFCAAAETDISNASRPIRSSEVDACRANGREPIGFYIAIDALAITVSNQNTFVDNLTIEQLAAIFSGTARTWADVNPAWPAEAIQLFSPGSDSGTYDYFVEEVFDSDETLIQNAPGIQFSEDDNVLVQGVEGSPYAIAYFGFAYYQENKELLRSIPIEGVPANEETGSSGEYPLARPLFIYTAPSIVAEKSQVGEFINFYLQNVNSQLGTSSDQIGYIPTNKYIQRANALYLLSILGGM